MKQLVPLSMCLLYPLFYVPINGRMNFEKAVFEVNKDYGTGNISIANTPAGTALSIFSNLIVALNGRIMIKLDIYSLAQKRRRLLLPLPKFNYCNLFRGLVSFDLIKTLVKEMNRYGNLTRECPISGYSTLVNFRFDDKKFGAFLRAFSTGKYLVHCNVADENAAKRVNIFGFDLNVAFTKS